MSEKARAPESNATASRPVLNAVQAMLNGTQESPGRLGPLSICAILIGFFLCMAALSGMFLHVFYQPSTQPEYGPDGKPQPYFSFNHRGFGHPAPLDGQRDPADFDSGSDSLIVPGESTPAFWETPSAAWLSVWRDIHARQPYGAYIRSIHRHSTGALFIILPLYLTALLFEMAAGRRGIRGPYYVALALGVLLVCMGFSGSVLPWSASGNAGASVAASYIGGIPFVGEALGQMFSGGAYVGDATLKRMFSAHTVWLPVVILLFLAAVVLFKRREITPGVSEGSKFLRSAHLAWMFLVFSVVMAVYSKFIANSSISASGLGVMSVCLPIGLTLVLQRSESTAAVAAALPSRRFKSALLSVGTLLGFAAFAVLAVAATPSAEPSGEIAPAGETWEFYMDSGMRPAWYLVPLRTAGVIGSHPVGASILALFAAAMLLYPLLHSRRIVGLTTKIVLMVFLALALAYVGLGLVGGPIVFWLEERTVATMPDAEAWILPGFLAFLALVVALTCHGLNSLRLTEDAEV